MLIEVLVCSGTSTGVAQMNLPDPRTGEMQCPHCHEVAPYQKWMPVEPMWDGRELRKIIGLSKDRRQNYWTPRFSAYFQHKHVNNPANVRLVRVFQSSQVKAFMESGVWRTPAQKKRRVK
jgi:hypothetical protein